MGVPRGAFAITLKHSQVFCTTSMCRYVERLIEHHVGAAYVNVARIVALYKRSLVSTESVDSFARTGNSLTRMPVACCVVRLMWDV
jgi:hypothetical protein